MSYVTLCIIVFLLQQSVFGDTDGYYWRDYYGKVPKDAFVAGKDINDDNVYIGKAYVQSWGLIPVQITTSFTEIFAPIILPVKVTYIQILCGIQNNFAWLTVNNTHFHVSLIDKKGVIGGHTEGLGLLHIGRINFQGGIKIGKVNSYDSCSAVLYFVDKTIEKSAFVFEVLHYMDYPRIDVRFKTTTDNVV